VTGPAVPHQYLQSQEKEWQAHHRTMRQGTSIPKENQEWYTLATTLLGCHTLDPKIVPVTLSHKDDGGTGDGGGQEWLPSTIHSRVVYQSASANDNHTNCLATTTLGAGGVYTIQLNN
jgi:hypothetical protein